MSKVNLTALDAMRAMSKGPAKAQPKLASHSETFFIVVAPRPGDGEGADVMGLFSNRDKAEALVDYLNDSSNEHYSPGSEMQEIESDFDYLGVLKLLTFDVAR